MTRRLRALRGATGGFTLVELLLATTILGIIMAALVSTMFVLLQTKRSTLEQLGVSHDAQNATSYFTNDAQGGAAVALGAPADCGSTATSLVRFRGNDYDAGSTSGVVLTTAWVWDPAQRQLLRRTCRGGTAAAVSVMAHDLQSAPSVSSSCDGTAPASASSPVVSLVLVGTDGGRFVLCARRRTA